MLDVCVCRRESELTTVTCIMVAQLIKYIRFLLKKHTTHNIYKLDTN
jgi:hypothetical protein